MFRNYFLDDITDFDDLKDFCDEYNCPVLDDVFDEDDLDERVNADVSRRVDNGGSWWEIRDWLGYIPTGYDWYRLSDYDDYAGLTDSDFEDFKLEVLDWGDEHEIWDEENLVPEEDDAEEEEEEYIEPSEAFSVSELASLCGLEFQTIQAVNESRVQAEKEAREKAEEEEGKAISEAFRTMYTGHWKLNNDTTGEELLWI